ncbi:hypothetical protein [Paenibacillus harenae]|uniref:Uncharacterized protein n=1 Tax=Paenibacillus harenae TaxID=306543 RepID=A0ABT9U3F3_PAEHA|nr:hypothetical protein [Paenibacillus harenae]MDQ0058695.1 hypothetical protein [Paenibacillus harenae]MDQ0114165.1 hypothetical protein [Paenibacillus harenae]
MNNETKNADVNGNNGDQATDSNERLMELIKAVHHNGLTALKMYFEDVEGQVVNQEKYGPVFLYQVKDESKNGYACGFFLQELVSRFQSGGDPAQWMSSFYFEMMNEAGGRPFPNPPATEEAAKSIIDNQLVPACMEAVREEFEPEKVHVGLDMNEQHGPVLEAGFPSIRDGNNVCAVPLQLLFTHLMLNRDPAELLLQGLYKIREEHGLQ